MDELKQAQEALGNGCSDEASVQQALKNFKNMITPITSLVSYTLALDKAITNAVSTRRSEVKSQATEQEKKLINAAKAQAAAAAANSAPLLTKVLGNMDKCAPILRIAAEKATDVPSPGNKPAPERNFSTPWVAHDCNVAKTLDQVDPCKLNLLVFKSGLNKDATVSNVKKLDQADNVRNMLLSQHGPSESICAGKSNPLLEGCWMWGLKKGGDKEGWTSGLPRNGVGVLKATLGSSGMRQVILMPFSALCTEMATLLAAKSSSSVAAGIAGTPSALGFGQIKQALAGCTNENVEEMLKNKQLPMYHCVLGSGPLICTATTSTPLQVAALH
jgi:hypothetical protein